MKISKGKKDEKKKKKVKAKKCHEDECYRCGIHGELIMCDVKACPKVYHLKCLSLTVPPSGWYMAII